MIPAPSWSSHHLSTPSKHSNWLNSKYFELNSGLRINIIIVIFISNNSLLGLSPNVLITFTKHETLNTKQHIFKSALHTAIKVFPCDKCDMWWVILIMFFILEFHTECPKKVGGMKEPDGQDKTSRRGRCENSI